MEIGDIIVSDGIKRKVIGLCLSEGKECPVTQLCEDGERPTEMEEEGEEKKEELGVTMQYLCKWCNRNCKSVIGLQAHEKACKRNPDSKNFKM